MSRETSNPPTTEAHEFVPDYAHDPHICGYELDNRNFCGEPRSFVGHRVASEPQAVPPDTIWIVCDGDDHYYTEGEEPEEGISYTRTSTTEADAEISRLQNGIRDYLIQQHNIPDDRIDGAGCDSGDPLDFTKAEIGQAFAFIIDKYETEASGLAEALRGLAVRFNHKDKLIAECWCDAWDWTKHTEACAAAREALAKHEGRQS